MLLAELADPERGFDAIVIGSSERAFSGQQFALMAPVFAHHGVAVWLPELGGEVDPRLAAHDELMVLLGVLAKREVTRARIRARTAMQVQARDEGRYLGGRPPYGYRLVDAGPHPRRVDARRGVRLHRLDVDPTTGPVVTWIFQERVAGRSMARIVRALNDMSIPCPGAADPERNPHRTSSAWTLPVVHVILANPRYTGRQVWNRMRTEHDLLDPDNPGLGHRDVMRRNAPGEWMVSEKQTHSPLVSEADFVAVQGMRALREAPGRVYRLARMLTCAQCGRRMESCWANGRAAYRCRHGRSSATGPALDRPRNAYVREDHVLEHLPALYIRITGRTRPVDVEEVIRELREQKIPLIVDSVGRTVTAGTAVKEVIFIG